MYSREHGKQQGDQDEFTDEQISVYSQEHSKQQSDQDEFTDEQISVYSREHSKQQGDQDEFTDEQVLECDHVAGQAGAGALLEPLYVHWKHMGIKP